MLLEQLHGLIIFNNKTFNKYYISKKVTGKSHGNAIGHVSFKLTRVIFKLLSNNIEFDLA